MNVNQPLHHYVPKWYQKRFLPHGQQKLWYLDLEHDRKLNPKEKLSSLNKIYYRPIKYCFAEEGLYSWKSFSFSSNFVEEVFFGGIDSTGKKAIETLASGDFSDTDLHQFLDDLVKYFSTQYFRTPRGIGVLLSFLRDEAFRLTPNALHNRILQMIRQLSGYWGTTWIEGVWEVVSAHESKTKFIISDSPVLTYNPDCFPMSEYCKYPRDPYIGWIGTQTLFALSMNKMLILTNRESLNKKTETQRKKLRKNFDPYRPTMFNFMDILRDRKLSDDQVGKINALIKQRSHRFVASANKAWLFPEATTKIGWKDYQQLLSPPLDKVTLEYKTFIKYTNGRVFGMDQDGVRITDRTEFEEMERVLRQALSKRHQKEDLE